MKPMRLSIIGTGYVGIVTGACFAERGHDVICVDIKPAKVAAVNQGRSPIFEQDLDELIRRNVLQTRRLRATTDLSDAIANSDLTMIAVPTPFDGNRIDLSYVERAARQVGALLRDKRTYHVVVVKSTVIPGTTDGLVRQALQEASGLRAGADFGLGMNPEFLSQGEAVRDANFPDRIVLGGIDPRSINALEALFEPWDSSVPRLRVNCRTAEMIKYASNGLLATMISFANDLGNLCSAMGEVDVVDVMRGLHLCKELTVQTGAGERYRAPIAAFLGAGCGFGGSCLPKDAMALVAEGERLGAPLGVLKAVVQTNQDQPRRMIQLAAARTGDLRGKSVAVMGLSFKPGTDDMRHSPAIPIIQHLLDAGAQIRAYDPAAADRARRIFDPSQVKVCDQLVDALHGASAIFLVTSWDEFRRLPQLLKDMDPAPLLVDGRRMFRPEQVPQYVGIGLGEEEGEL